MNTKSHLTPERIRRSTRWRVQPLRRLTPEILTQQLDAFDAGYLREATLTWATIEQRDDLIRTVVSKRIKSVARHDYAVLPLPNLSPHESAQAQSHIDALNYFYANLTVTDALNENEHGGFNLLIRQMMSAIGRRYAVHEILWQPETGNARAQRTQGDTTPPRWLTAECRHVPLEFFENTTGRLRFLETDSATQGVPLAENGWMITVGEGLMVATSLAWMSKHLALNDWLLYSERNGTPGVRGITTAARDSVEWTAMVEAVSELLNGSAIVTNATEDIRLVDFAVGGEIPFPALVERMDRFIAALWRGTDLSTISREQGYGVSLQEREASLLEEDDVVLITETLNRTLDAQVIRLVFGDTVKPLARIKLLGVAKECTEFDLKIDSFLLQHGAPLGVADLLERYGRRHATNKADSLPTPARSESMANSRVHLPSACVTPFASLANEWIQLTPLGEFPHAQGWQRVDAASVRAMVHHFKSFWTRLGRRFGGLPFYLGHPDASPNPSETKALGWILDLEARVDGLYARVKWTSEGRALIEGGYYKFHSPYWEAESIGIREGQPLFRPTRLLSAGLTNQPNLPVLPLANATVVMPPNVSDLLVETAIQGGWITPAQESDFRLHRIEATLANHQVKHRPPMPVADSSQTRHLAGRSQGPAAAAHRMQRVRDAVAKKTANGLNYNEAWEHVKCEQPRLFDLMRSQTLP